LFCHVTSRQNNSRCHFKALPAAVADVIGEIPANYIRYYNFSDESRAPWSDIFIAQISQRLVIGFSSIRTQHHVGFRKALGDQISTEIDAPSMDRLHGTTHFGLPGKEVVTEVLGGGRKPDGEREMNRGHLMLPFCNRGQVMVPAGA